MKRLALVVLAIAWAVVLFGSGAVGGQEPTITVWQIGVPDGRVSPALGAGEYPATGAYSDHYDFYVDLDGDPAGSPSVPGYLADASYCGTSANPLCTDATAELHIHFRLDCDYEAGDLTLFYPRYDSEADDLFLDGNWLATVLAREGHFRSFWFDLGPLAAGEHTLTISYADGGEDNGHYIDQLELAATFECAPLDGQLGEKAGNY